MDSFKQGDVVHVEKDQAPLPADPMITMIERVVMDPDADLAKLESMLDMKERMEDRAARRAFDAAIASAKADIPTIEKTGEVDYTHNGKRTNFKHETLSGIAAVVDPILSANGLSYRFRSTQEDGNVVVTCIVAHREGYSEETTLRGSPDTSGSKNAYQAVGSAVTYLQRYTLKLALGLSAAADDDAQGVDMSGTISADQFTSLKELMDTRNVSRDKLEERMLKHFKIEHLEELPLKRYAEADTLLRQTPRKVDDAQTQGQ